MSDLDHAKIMRTVQQFHDEFRTIILSKKYYAHRLELTKHQSFITEVVLAISASSSFASLFTAIKFNVISEAVPFISAAVAMLAAVKPILGLDKNIERLARLASMFAGLAERAKRVEAQISIDSGISEETCRRIESIQTDLDRLASDEDLKPNRKLLAKLQTEVEQEVPISSLWHPETTFVL